MKLLSSYNHTFNVQSNPDLTIWEIVKDIPSLNGLYIASSNYLYDSYIGTTSTNKVSTWYNILGDTNYLYAVNDSTRPTLNTVDSQFNNYPSIDFNDNGTTYLQFKFPVLVGTIIMVYSIRVNGGYIIYAPVVDLVEFGVWSHYDAFPTGNSSLWLNETKLSGSVYNATSRINGKEVSPDVFVPLNNTRILTVKNIDNSDKKHSVLGFGGQTGALGGVNKGTGNPSNTNSFKGKLAAVITFENDIDITKVVEIEAKLAELYIDYKGVSLSSIPSFRYLVGDSFSFDFSTIAVDEWFVIEDYELVEPLDLGISFSGSVLSGYLTDTYIGKFKIKITNSANLISYFEFDLEIVKTDPIIEQLPEIEDISLILSSYIESGTQNTYGIYIEGNTLVKWEDARRIDVPVYESVEGKQPSYIESDFTFNDTPVISFLNNSEILGTTVTGKTFIWVYEQTTYGFRNMLNTFPDIKGQGQLWTVPNTDTLHGNTDITKLVTSINRLNINTLSYKLKLNTLYIIVATQPDDISISFNGLKNMRGKLAMFISWDSILSDENLNLAISVLADRYFRDLNPVIVDDNTEFKTTSSISIDLTKKVLDIKGEAVTYDVVVNPNEATIEDGFLNLTSNTDELLYYEIECTNESSLTSVLKFYVDVTLRTNSLYLTLKNIFSNFTLFLLPEPDTLTLDEDIITTWKDYRLNGNEYSAEGAITLSSLVSTDNKTVLNFNIDGSDSLIGDSISGKGFIFAYIKKTNSTGRFFLLGQEEDSDFSTGLDNYLLDSLTTSSDILASNNYVNTKQISNSYRLKTNVLNVIILNSVSSLSFTRIAKDRLFSDRSIKGYIGLVIAVDRNITEEEQKLINKSVRDYYDSPKYITVASFNNTLVDRSVLNKNITGTVTFSSTIKKFGSHSLHLITNSICSRVFIPNNTSYALLYEDFTIAMWLALNTVTTSLENIVVYQQTDLIIYLSGYTVYVGSTLIKELSYLTYTLPNSLVSNSYTFFHLEVTRVEGILRLFINGVLVAQDSLDKELRDDTTSTVLGQSTNLTSVSGLNLYIDEFMVYRRLGLHTSTFTVPVSEYVV